MTKLFLVLLVFSVLIHSGLASENKKSSLLEFYKYDQLKAEAAASDTVVLDTYHVTSSRISANTQLFDDLEKEIRLNQHRFDFNNPNSRVSYVATDGDVFTNDRVDDEARIASRQLAMKYLGEIDLFGIGHMYVNGGIKTRVTKDVSIVARTFLHGSRGLAVEFAWPHHWGW